MSYEPEHPEHGGVPDHTLLGPDPEPIGHRNHLPLLAPASNGRAARPKTCPLAAALGNQTPCTGGDCLYFRIPGVPLACAVEHWAPEARHDQALAHWFLARRLQAAGAPD